MLRLQIDSKTYPHADQNLDAKSLAQQPLTRPLFEQFELSLEPGELLCLLGPSGCGKSSLLQMIAGLDADFKGSLELSAASESISYMFQQPRLLPWRTLRQNLALVIAPDQYPRIEPLVAAMGLSAYVDAYPGSLSLGMARRAALARSLIVEPKLILMDEPFVSLDPPTVKEMHRLVNRLRQLRPQTAILFVTHDLREAVTLADRVLVLGGLPTRILHQWQGKVPQQQRDARYLAEQMLELSGYEGLNDWQ